MVISCHFCEDTLTGTHHFKPCQCDHYYHADCFHYQVKCHGSDGISAIQCQHCHTYYERGYISSIHRHMYQMFRTISQKFFWLYGGIQTVTGVATIILWDPKHLIDSLATVSVIYNTVLWTAIMLTSV